MATAFDTDMQTQFIEASTRALSASAELYTQILKTQAEAARSVFEAFSGISAQAARTGAETTEQAAETTARTTTRAARSTARTAERTTRRATGATRRATGATRRAATPVTRASNAAVKPPIAAVTPAANAAVKPPIAGYDDLTTDEIVAKLPEQSQTALAEIATYEKAKENRATVLQRVAALTGPEPTPGYDELNADEAQALVTNGSADLAATVRDYEPRHKDRASVVEAAVRHGADASS
jgi:hypothetical protein